MLRDFHVFHRSVPSVVELAVLPLICIKKRCADCAANYKVPRTQFVWGLAKLRLLLFSGERRDCLVDIAVGPDGEDFLCLQITNP